MALVLLQGCIAPAVCDSQQLRAGELLSCANCRGCKERGWDVCHLCVKLGCNAQLGMQMVCVCKVNCDATDTETLEQLMGNNH